MVSVSGKGTGSGVSVPTLCYPIFLNNSKIENELLFVSFTFTCATNKRRHNSTGGIRICMTLTRVSGELRIVRQRIRCFWTKQSQRMNTFVYIFVICTFFLWSSWAECTWNDRTIFAFIKSRENSRSLSGAICSIEFIFVQFGLSCRINSNLFYIRIKWNKSQRCPQSGVCEWMSSHARMPMAHFNVLREFHEIEIFSFRYSAIDSHRRRWHAMHLHVLMTHDSKTWNAKRNDGKKIHIVRFAISHDYDFLFCVRSESDCVCECATSITWRRENTEEEPKNREKNKHVVGRKQMEIFEIVSDT